MDFRQIYFLLFLCLQDQMEELTKQTQTRNDKMQRMMEQIVLSNKSSQKEKTDRQNADWLAEDRWKMVLHG